MHNSNQSMTRTVVPLLERVRLNEFFSMYVCCYITALGSIYVTVPLLARTCIIFMESFFLVYNNVWYFYYGCSSIEHLSQMQGATF